MFVYIKHHVFLAMSAIKPSDLKSLFPLPWNKEIACGYCLNNSYLRVSTIILHYYYHPVRYYTVYAFSPDARYIQQHKGCCVRKYGEERKYPTYFRR